MRGSKLVVALLAALLAAGCSSVKLDKGAPVEDRSGQAEQPAPAAAGVNAGAVSSAAADPLNDPNGALAKRSVYFDFDKYAIKDEYKSLVEAHAKYLVSRPDRKVSIQGNADERGGSEYNLALGQKRAEAVRKALNLLGVKDAQVEAVSFGKEKPKALGHDEAAWAENRRADFAY